MIAQSDTPPPPVAPSSSIAKALYKFSRPHTMRGTLLGSMAGCARAVLEARHAIDWGLIPTAGLGVLALLFGNVFIVGINQIYDVRIDKVNKPFLPLAAREMSPRIAWTAVWASGAVGLAIVRLCFSKLIMGMYSFAMLIGALYSVPPFRFKRYPLMAAVTISCVRGFLLNFGVYHATKAALKVPFAWSPPITFLAVFMSIFASVIAMAKDLPDIRGDRMEGVPTFASKVGSKKMVQFVVALLGLNYAWTIILSFVAPAGAFKRVVLGLGHLVLAGWLWVKQGTVRPENQDSIKDFYAFIWKLFYAEYLLFPFI